MKNCFKFGWFACLLGWCLVGTTLADVRLPAVLSDGMVVQRDKPIHLWGWADAEESIKVQCGSFLTTAAVKQGRWQVDLPPLAAGPVPEIIIQGKNILAIKDVLAGEVWLCSGQSNMQMVVRNSLNAKEEIAAADHPRLRIFTVGRDNKANLTVPQDNVTGAWKACSPSTIENQSAVGYFFGRELLKKLDVPIGMISSSVGGTLIESWTPASAIESVPELAPIVQRAAQYAQNYPQTVKEYEKKLVDWSKALEEAKAAGKPAPRRPAMPANPAQNVHLYSRLYNGMIAPLTAYPIKGVIWYQGESNAPRAEQYRILMPLMIQSWRQAWNQPQMPFGMVQLANFKAPAAQPGQSDWAELREAQSLAAATVPNTGLALAIDIGEEKDIHPKNKQEVGRRLALWALATVYGQSLAYSGPIYQSMQIKDNAIHLSFKHAGEGLVAKDNQPLTGFAIAGEDQKWVWAQATIQDATVIVTSPQVAKPVAVRYGWADNPPCNLYNKQGLPASPFRTDDWPLATKGKQ